MRRSSLCLILALGCTFFEPKIVPPSAEIQSPDIVVAGTDFFLLARATSRQGITDLAWSFSADSETGASLANETENTPIARFHAEAPGDLTVHLHIVDPEGEAFVSQRIKIIDRPFGRTQLVTGTQTDSRLGDLVFAAGDLDDDDHADAIAAAPAGKVGFRRSGFVEVFLGTDDGLAQSPALSLSLAEGKEGDAFGSAVAAGDFDGDSVRDLAIGIPGYDAQFSPDSGRVVIFFGRTDALLDATAPLFIEPPAPDFGGDIEGDRFGSGLAVADWNQDGLSDLAISAPQRERFETDFVPIGEISLFFGRADRALVERDLTLIHGSAETRVDALSPEALGEALVALPSVCGDSRPELAASLRGYDRADTPDVGAVIIYCAGDAAFFDTTNGLFYLPPDGASGDEFGAAITPLGDVDLDGQSEIAISAPGHQGQGAIYLVNFSGASYTKVSPPSNSSPRFGEKVAGADADGNGMKDLVVGAPEDGTGVLLIFLMNPNGISAPLRVESPSVDLEQFGFSVVELGDVDQDEITDLAAGTPGLPEGGLRLIF